MNNKKLSLFVALALIAGIVAGYLLGAGRPAVSPSVTDQQQKDTSSPASIMIDFGDGSIRVFDSVPSGETLLIALRNATTDSKLTLETKDYKDLGTLITKIGTKTNGENDRYWQYWVNNKSAETGAGAYVIQPNDVIEWKFTPFASN